MTTSLKINERISVLETKQELIAQESYRRFDATDEKIEKISNTIEKFIGTAEWRYAKQEGVNNIQNKIWWAVTWAIVGLGSTVIWLVVYIWNTVVK